MSNGLTKPLGSDPGLRQKLDRVAVSYLDVFKDIFLEPTEKTHIEIRNFGVFDIFYTNERSNARNINTGQSVIIPKRKKIVFKASKKIKEKLYK